MDGVLVSLGAAIVISGTALIGAARRTARRPVMPTDRRPEAGESGQGMTRDVLLARLDELLDENWILDGNTFEFLGVTGGQMLIRVHDATVFVHHRRRGKATLFTSRFLGPRVVEEAVAFTNVLRAPGA